jgi:hypothetical protein
MRFVKPALLALIVCAMVAGAAGPLLRAETGPSKVGEPLEADDKSGSGERCILLISACPIDNPLCGKEPVRVTVNCTDPSCVPGSCIPASGGSSSAVSSRVSSSGNTDSCMLRRFECVKGSLYSCFKRWRSKEISCNDSACIGTSCMKSDVFFSTYTLQPWDMDELKGPFPRTEMMCVIQRSACPPDDPACLSAVSLEQIPCDDVACTTGSCTRSAILVDQNDQIVSATPAGSTSGQTGTSNEEERGSGGDEESSGTSNGGTTVTRSQPLGCFDVAGAWTTDRTKCAENQQPYVQPQVSGNAGQDSQEAPEEQKKAERIIEQKFVADTKRTAIVQSLLSSTTEAVGRISTLLESSVLPQEVRTELEKQQEALRTAQRAAAVPEQSIRELQLVADTVSARLQEVQKATQPLQGSVSPPFAVTDRLDRIFTGLPAIFGLMFNEQIPVDSATVDAYLTAQTTYDSVRASCLEQPASCSDLVQAIDALEPVFAGLRLALETAGRTDLELQIDALLQE